MYEYGVNQCCRINVTSFWAQIVNFATDLWTSIVVRHEKINKAKSTLNLIRMQSSVA
ncbi:unnamed protein product [Strongylus vulgaris]|uniref:Uncharacterized protein n=1 Tax=Strongylus vulgaris TaxID=40348 RepID=A0A3P7LR71_STRVU|nr:unnamed protein product [Strongylus vulgaris]